MSAPRYGEPGFGHARRMERLRAEAEAELAEAARRRAQVEQEDALFQQRQADEAAREEELAERRAAQIDARLEPERVKTRRQWLIDNPTLSEFTFDTKVWPLVREQLLEAEQEARFDRYMDQGGMPREGRVGYRAGKAATEAEVLARRQEVEADLRATAARQEREQRELEAVEPAKRTDARAGTHSDGCEVDGAA